MSEQGADDVSQKGSQYLLHLYRGSDFLLKEQVAEARQELEEASRIDPDDPKGLSLLGLVYFRLDEFDRAQQIYELLVARYPEEAPLRVNLGLVYMKQGRAEAARDEMLRAVEYDPNHQRAYGYLGLLWSEAGEHERARVAFAKAGQDAMVQRMEELIAQRGPSEPSAAGAGPQERLPAGTQEAGTTSGPPLPRAPQVADSRTPPQPFVVHTATLQGSPFGAMPPMTSDAMTQPVALEEPPAAQAAGGVDPFASWGAELDGVGEEQAVQVEPTRADGVSGVPSTWMETEPDRVLDGGEPASAGAEPRPLDFVDSPPELEGHPQDAIPSSPLVQRSPAEAPAAVPEPWVAEGPPEESGRFIDDADVSDALDQAVGPEEPWPTNVGGQRAVVPEGGAAEGLEERLPVPRVGAPDAPLSSGPVGVEAVPIFAFATTDLVDFGARHERMSCTPDGLLLVSIEEEGFFRAESLVAEVGDLQFSPVFRRTKGANTEEPMQDRRGRFLKARGEGRLLCSPGADRLVVLDLFDDFIYIRSEVLFAFESTLHWENGKIRGQLGAIPLLHVRGEGRLALACDPGLRKLRLVPDQPALVAEEALIGWVGRVIPQTVPRPAPEGCTPLGAPLLRCEGEGVLLVLPGRVASGSWSSAPSGGEG